MSEPVPLLPPITLSPRLVTLAGREAQLSAALFVAGIAAGFISLEGLGSLLIFGAFLPLVPLVLALHEFHHSASRRLNTIARMSGLLGVACFALMASVNLLVLVLHIPDQAFQNMWWVLALLLLATSGLGLWLVLTGYLLIKADILPLVLALVGCVVGLCYLGLIALGPLVPLVLTMMPFAGRLYIFVLMVLLSVGHIIWSIWIGGWVLSLDEHKWQQEPYAI